MDKEILQLNFQQTIEEIAKFDFILSEGRKGNHLLFDVDTIRDTFRRDQDELFSMFETRLEDINEILNDVFSIHSFEEKREYLSSLPKDMQSALVYGYFQLLDSQLDDEASEPTLH